MRVLAFTRYGRDAASTRYRLLQFLPALEEAGIEVDVHPLLEEGHMQRLVEGGRPGWTSTLARYGQRLSTLASERRPELIWVYSDLFPYLPAALETLAMPGGVPVIYDWDDAFHIAYRDGRFPGAGPILAGKFGQLFRRAAAVTCGNAYLRDYAEQYCPRSIVIPTVVDTELYVPAPPTESKVIGWIGSPSTWGNVRPLFGLLARLHQSTGVRIRAIGAGSAAEVDRFEGLDLIPWREETEIAEVRDFDIGIMPLLDRPFERGKSGFKLIQYMACAHPVVASPVGVNETIVRHCENGFLARSEAQWDLALRTLLSDPVLCRRLGEEGRRTAVQDYSLASQAPRLVDLFRETGGGPPLTSG
jgi:glycosyltransferase involved in cell wall biosynthesis